MSVLAFTVPGAMRGKQRPRASSFGGRVRMFTPSETVNAEAFVKQCFVQAHGQPVLEGPLGIAVEIEVAIPPSWSKKKQIAAMSGDIYPTGKPDADNSLKLIADSLNGIAWRDDAQLVLVTVRKNYGGQPSTKISIWRLGSE